MRHFRTKERSKTAWPLRRVSCASQMHISSLARCLQNAPAPSYTNGACTPHQAGRSPIFHSPRLLRGCFKTSREPRCKRCGTRCKTRRGGTRRHINGEIWRRGTTQQRAPHRRNPKGRLPLWRRASFRLLDDPLFVSAPCPAPQLKPSRPRAVLKQLLREGKRKLPSRSIFSVSGAISRRGR